MSIHSFVEWLDTFSYVLRSADVTVQEVNHIRCFAIDIAKYLILLSCRLAMELSVVRVAIGDSTCNACHHMVYTGRPSMKVYILYIQIPGADPGFGIRRGVSRRGIWGPLKVPSGSRAEP